MTLKQYILIRTDEIFPIGKIMAHVGHNVLCSYLDYSANLTNLHYTKWNMWFYMQDQTKIALDGGSLEDIEKIIKKASQLGVPTAFIEDVHIKKKIVAVIGPVDEKQAKYLGLDKLRLYK